MYETRIGSTRIFLEIRLGAFEFLVGKGGEVFGFGGGGATVGFGVAEGFGHEPFGEVLVAGEVVGDAEFISLL